MKKIITLFQKEILDILRDKKTLIMMILVPLLLYPLLLIGISVVISTIAAKQMEEEYVVAFCNIPEETVSDLKSVAEKDVDEIDYKLSFVETHENCEEKLNNKEIDAFLILKEESDLKVPAYEISYLSAVTDSYTAASAMAQVLENYQEELRLDALEEYHLDETILTPISYEKNDKSTMEEGMAVNVGGSLGFLIVMTIFMGAIYPTIDVTAGEKERGTLETLLTLPVTNFELIISKYLAVSLITCITAFLSIASLGGSVAFMINQFAGIMEETGIDFQVQGMLPAIIILVILMLTLALLVTAVCMSVCVFAKSFKEANNYITPVMLFIMFGAYPAMLPDLELNSTLALVPVLNVVLTVKQLFSMNFQFGLYGIVFFSNLAYSILIIWILARIYKSENVLFADGFTSFQLFQKRSEMKSGSIPKVGDSFLLLCVVLLLMLYAGTAATLKLGFGGVIIQQLFILICPLGFAWYMKANFKETFALKKISIRNILGSIFAFMGFYPVLLLISSWISKFLPNSAQNVNDAFAFVTDQPIFLLIFAIALLPAVGEELLFRGFFFSSLKKKCRPIVAILLVSAVFGLFHMSIIKFFTTSLLGLVLVLLTYKTGSIFSSMIFHFLNNCFSVVAMKYPEKTEQFLPILCKEQFEVKDICMLLLFSAICILFSSLLLFYKKKTKA